MLFYNVGFEPVITGARGSRLKTATCHKLFLLLTDFKLVAFIKHNFQVLKY